MSHLWLSPVNNCDHCKAELVKEKPIYDCKLHFGPWALVCETCFHRYGVGLGSGYGQKYEFKELVNNKQKAWVKVEG